MTDTTIKTTTIDTGAAAIADLPCLFPTCAECPYVAADGTCGGDLPIGEDTHTEPMDEGDQPSPDDETPIAHVHYIGGYGFHHIYTLDGDPYITDGYAFAFARDSVDAAIAEIVAEYGDIHPATIRPSTTWQRLGMIGASNYLIDIMGVIY